MKKNINVFGPDKFASQLEGSKIFMKNLCKQYNIPTANFEVFENFKDASDFIEKSKIPIVIKADGLASGKGVVVCSTIDEALKNAKEVLSGKFKSSSKLVVEEFLHGEELSYFVITIFLELHKIIKELVKVTLVQTLAEWVLILLLLY